MKRVLLLITSILVVIFCILFLGLQQKQIKPIETEQTQKQNELKMDLKEKKQENDIQIFETYLNEPEEEVKKVFIKIFKEKRVLELYGDNILIAKFKIGLGNQPLGDKRKEGDRKTPEGNYYICTINRKSQFTLFFGISYPNIKDAEQGFEEGLITQEEYTKIIEKNNNKECPLWNTNLGGEVGIHGGGNLSDWTWGCIALSDHDIKILGKYIKLSTPVEILK